MALDLTDYSPNSYTLTNNSGSESSDVPFSDGGKNTTAISFNGSSQNATQSSVITSTGSALTVEFWIKPNSDISSGTWGLFYMGENTSDADVRVDYEYNGGTRRLLFGRNKYFVAINSFTYNITLGTSWTHIALVWDSSTVEGFVNGSSVGTVASTGNGSGNDFEGVNIGSRGAANYANAIFDDIRIWSTNRTSTQISNNRSLELTGSETNLAAYWPLEDPNAVSTTGYFFMSQ
jgi:hypothetical protein